MIKTLYNSEVYNKGIEKGIATVRLEHAENFLRLGVSEEIVSKGIGIPIEEIRKMKESLLIKSDI